MIHIDMLIHVKNLVVVQKILLLSRKSDVVADGMKSVFIFYGKAAFNEESRSA
jgi:hypothetical protein